MSSTAITRQQQITREQVSCKLQDAKRRVSDALQASCEATTAADYSAALRDLYKAANEHSNWSIVYRALTR